MTSQKNNLFSNIAISNEEAFKNLFNLYYEPLVSYCYSILGDLTICEDLVQEIFIKFWFKEKYNNIHTSIESYLYFSVKNSALYIIRSEKVKIKNLESFKHEHSQVVEDEQDLQDYDISEKLYKSIEKLPQARKRIFLMCCSQELKYQEVASQLNISVNTVKVQMGRALKFLRENLSNFILIL